MRSKIFVLLTVTAMMLNVVGLAAADTHGGKKKARQSNALVALLPASDGVATFDAHRFFNVALPQVLSKNPTILSKFTAHLTEIEGKTGIDLRKFDSVVVGTTIVKADAKKFTMDPVAIARGDLKVETLLAAAKLGAKSDVRQEKYGSHTIYIFSAKEAMQNAKAAPAAAAVSDVLESLPKEIAVTSLSENTLAIGSLARVRETIDGATHVSPEVTGLLSTRESAVATFAVKAPNGMSSFLPLENDELGNSVDSIQYASGTMDVDAAGAAIQIAAKTAKPEQAKKLFETLDGLKMLGKAFLGGSKRPDQQIYARLIENAKLAVKGNSVSLDISIPQADIDAMVASMK